MFENIANSFKLLFTWFMTLVLQSAREIWKELGDFWVEMLAYSANRCTVNNHAQRLRYGGEFLTHVWLLVAHFGLTHHHFQRWMFPSQYMIVIIANNFIDDVFYMCLFYKLIQSSLYTVQLSKGWSSSPVTNHISLPQSQKGLSSFQPVMTAGLLWRSDLKNLLLRPMVFFPILSLVNV